MGYLVKEIFGPTVQGEGAHSGSAFVFLRFAGCNLACSWCDTDSTSAHAQTMSADTVVSRVVELDVHAVRRLVVTGGEPTLQWDAALAQAARAAGLRVHLETNGTRPLLAPVDWLTVSPKPRFHRPTDTLVLRGGDECKLVVDDSVGDADLEGYERLAFTHFFLQPCMDARWSVHAARAVELALRHPRWRISVQLHKLLGVE